MNLVLKDTVLLRQRALIDGRWCAADTDATLAVRNPANAQPLGTVPLMGAAETCRAIAAAERGQASGKARSAKERSQILRRWFDLIVAIEEDLAAILTSDQGKPLVEARGEILYAASFVDWFAEEAKRVNVDVIPSYQPGQRIVVLRQPVGVCAAITPWNFPAAMITRNAAPALAVGCTKPDTFHRASARGSRPACRCTGRRVQCRDRRRAGHRWRDDREFQGMCAQLHRLDRSRARAEAPER